MKTIQEMKAVFDKACESYINKEVDILMEDVSAALDNSFGYMSDGGTPNNSATIDCAKFSTQARAIVCNKLINLGFSCKVENCRTHDYCLVVSWCKGFWD